MAFALDAKLQQDCITLAESENSLLLLLNNRKIPWFILVPKTDCIEFIDLEEQRQVAIMREVNRVGNMLRKAFKIDKLNIATIGNIVSQLHIHIIGRTQDDYCWPGVAWGAPGAEVYPQDELSRLRDRLANMITGIQFELR